MGGAIALAAAAAGYDVTAANPTTAKLAALKASDATGTLKTTTDNLTAARDADLIVLAVKPYLISKVMKQVLAAGTTRTTVVSLAAGISLAELRQIAGSATGGAGQTGIVRVMPNIAATVGESMSFVCGDDQAVASGAVADVCALFDTMGKCDTVDESLFGATMALASCGIAFAMRYIRATVTAAVATGIRPADALRYSLQTIRGALALLEASPDIHVEAQIDRVCTPGGVTIRGLEAMERNGFSPAVSAGIHASAN